MECKQNIPKEEIFLKMYNESFISKCSGCKYLEIDKGLVICKLVSSDDVK